MVAADVYFLLVELYYHHLYLVTIASSIIAIALQCSVWPVGVLLFGKESKFITTED